MIKTGIRSLRDPFVLREGNAYYLYGTGVLADNWADTVWACYKSTDGLLGEWKLCDELVYERPCGAEKQLWAPEVHKYNGKFYMLASYYSSLTGHRGCAILRAESPEGRFVEISNGHVTPSDWDAIDKIGRMAVARLSEDLTHLISEPKELFRANDPSWTNNGCTDGPFIYKASDGALLMLWSNFIDKDYCVGIARSESGRVNGEWTHCEELLFSKEMAGCDDGGHGMIFTDRDGKTYLSIHTPNRATDTVKEEVVFIPVREENGTLVCVF